MKTDYHLIGKLSVNLKKFHIKHFCLKKANSRNKSPSHKSVIFNMICTRDFFMAVFKLSLLERRQKRYVMSI